MMTRNGDAMRAWVLAGALALCAAAGAGAQDLRVGLQDDPDNLDPAVSFSFVGRHVLASLCDTLTEIDTQWKIVPRLAVSWETSGDGLSATMKLRPNVVFHDGERFDAAAVKYNLDRNLTLPESRRKGEIGVIKSVEVVDDLTVRINLQRPFAPLFAQFADRSGMMVSPKAAGAGGAQFGNNLVCSGPYKLVRRVIQDRIWLEKFDRHWEAQRYHFKTVVFGGMPDATTRLTNLRSGQLDLIERVTAQDMATVKGDPKLRLVLVPSRAYQGITFNIANGTAAQGSAFARSAKLRLALEAAIDREALVQVVSGGVYIPTNQAFPPGDPFYNAAIPVPKRDLARARALLAQSGTASPTLTLLVPTDTERQQIAQIVQLMAKEAGIEVKLQSVEFITMLAQQRKGEFEGSLVGWSGRADPDGNLHLLVHSGAPTNDGKYANPAVDKALDEARTAADPGRRKALYDMAAEALAEDRPIIYLFSAPWLFGMAAKLDGFVAYPDGIIRLAGVTFR
jgi:peptide/nickel transport system substrate-binding protein